MIADAPKLLDRVGSLLPLCFSLGLMLVLFCWVLGARFQHMRWFSQRNAFVSMIVPDTGEGSVAADTISGETLTVTKANPESLAAALPALYFVVVAGNDNAAMQTVAARVSMFGDSEEWAYNDYRENYKAAVAGRAREHALNARCAELEQQLAALGSQPAASVESTSPNLEK